MSTEERTSWAPAFAKIGYSLEQVLAMTTTEFTNCRYYLESEGYKPGPIKEQTDEEAEAAILKEILNRNKAPQKNQRQQNRNPNREIRNPNRVRVPPPMPRLTPEQIDQIVKEQEETEALIKKQNKEFKEAEAKMQKKIDSKKEEAVKLSSKFSEVIENAKNIPPEPEKTASGAISIAVSLPNGNRIIRNFYKNESAQDVFFWAAEKIMNLENPPVIKEFELKMPTGGSLDNQKTLEEQGIAGRTMLNALIINRKV